MKGKGIVLTGGLIGGTALKGMAQVPETGFINLSPQFFFSVIAGVILALAFQLLLSALATATGISLIGNIKDKFTGNKNENKSDKKDESSESSTPLGVKITSAAGLWSVLASAISLFFASWLAVRFSLIADVGLGITLGLVIWALTMTTVAYLDYRVGRSITGTIWNMAREGFKASADTAKAIFGKSEEDKMANVAQKTVGAIRSEIAGVMDNNKIVKNFDDYIQKMQPKDLDYDKIKDDLVSILNELEFKQKTEFTDEGLLKKTFVEIAESTPTISKEKASKLKQTFDEAKGIVKSGGSNADKLTEAFDKFTPGTDEDAENFRKKVADYLNATDKKEFTADRLKKDIETIMRDPVSSKDIMRRKIKSLDRAAIVNAISARTDIDEEEAKKVVSQVQNVVLNLGNKLRENKEKTAEVATEGSSKATKQMDKAEGVLTQFENKVRKYFNSMDREELNYDRMKQDFTQMLHDPNAAVPILKERFQKFDKDTMVALISANSSLSKGEAELIFEKFEEAKQDTLDFAEKVEEKTKETLEYAKLYALQQAENTRKTAMSASWWVVATLVISGVAAVLGSLIPF
ncbi:hypothetical protein RCC89_08325 [Cytophagaceae bacterium ABcell3]|nr:hypothetical protein RCC89_08325 [Cytophagaceae bacterium ABcell3]